MAVRTDAHSNTTHMNDNRYKTQYQKMMLEHGGKGYMIITFKGRHADTRQMDDWPRRLLEECPIVSSFSVCHALSSFYFLVSSFVSSQSEKISRCPTGDIPLPRIKCSYPGLIRMVILLFFPLWRPIPDVLSTWHLAEAIPVAHLCGLQPLHSKLQSEKHTTWHQKTA